MSLRPRLAVLAALGLAALAPPASAAPISLHAARAVERSDCATTGLAAQPGVTRLSYTVPTLGYVTARLNGPAGSDWDLGVFDHATGRNLGGSADWDASELVQTFARAGQRLDVQACRVSGPASSVPVSVSTYAPPAPQGAGLTSDPSTVRISLPNGAASLGLLEDMGVNVDEDASAKGVTAIVDTPQMLQRLHAAGFATKTLIPDMGIFERRQAAHERAYQARVGAAGSPLPSGRTDYRHLADFGTELKKLVQTYPAIVKPVTLPKKTFQGREQQGVEISADVLRTDDQKPTAVIVGEHHAREWPSAEIPTEFALYLASNFGTDKEVTDLLQHARVVIVPVINPDGYNSSREAADPADNAGDPGGAPSLAESVGAGGSLAYRRKNCDGPGANPAAPCDLTTGVDPNRNYGLGWGGLGASSSPNSQSYRGGGPWSEPETQSVHEFSQSRDITSLLTMHNFASLVLRPPGLHTGGPAPDEARLKALGDAMAADTGYTSEYGYQLYDTSGTTEDWNYGAAGTFGYTIEMGPASGDGGNFHISYDRAVIDQWTGGDQHPGRGLRRALLRIAEASAIRQDHSTLIGRAPAGRVLHLRKAFKTSTSPVCAIASPADANPFSVLQSATGQPPESPTDCVNPGDVQTIDDHLDYKTTVPANGVFSWIVTPSTRPFQYKAGKRETWTLTCEDSSGKVYESRDVTIWRGEVQSFELPCGGTLAGSAPATFAQAQASALVDKSAPTTAIDGKTSKSSRSRILLRGTASDTAPNGLKARVAKVRVAIALRTGKLCRFMGADGVFGKKVSCHRTSYTVAQVAKPAGRVSWRYLVGRRLPAGRYLAWSRGIDAAGNVERKANARNLLRFTIR
jgi:zinc carboxypeptidase